MNLIFIYGPPASGKLTIATELSTLTGYPVFHNHLTRDLVQSMYPHNLIDNYELVDILRKDVFRYCAQHDTNLIFTFVYDGPQDDEVVRGRVAAIEDNGGTVLFVELTASHDELLQRVTDESRKQHNKLTDTDTLSSLLEKSYSSMPYENIFKIDTSRVEPAEAAELIVDHFGLNQKPQH